MTNGIMATETEYCNFKHLLEYFVAHVEYVATHEKTHVGYETYIRPLEEAGTFKLTGLGYEGQQIQQQVTAWSKYSVGEIAINCSPQYGNYRTRLCYLNWVPTGLNINAKWQGDHISDLLIEIYEEDEGWETFVKPISLTDLGLYDGSEPNDKVKALLDSFFTLKMEYNRKMEFNAMKERLKSYTTILEKSYNLILTGAPGTGKTFLAKQIARIITEDDESIPSDKSHIAFVQFHPSYDYTDFVEGLRPTKPGSDGNIGFVRQDGIFKVFCKRAIESTINARKDNFEEAWQKLVDWLEENEFAEVENLNGKTTFEVELNENGNGLATRIYATEEERQKHVITPGRSRYYNKEQLYRVYRGLAGVPNGGHDNYRKAVLKMMMSKFGLSEYNPGSEENTPSKPKYVIIIDEINRGDIAKIFGELFFAIDPGYRGIAGRVKTQYSNLVGDDDVFKDGFYVPDNVYIIGTMNDIDRNVESMDFAIRRRFTWREVSPEETVYMLSDKDHGIPEYEEIAVKHMEKINALIVNTPGLGPAYQIGASYFLKLRDYKGDFSKLWDYHIAPLLREYLRGLPNAENDFAKLHAAWDSVNQPQDTAQ
ncbi:MAG: AAA family ATPase [Victivallales bacterium]|nr:AAA family ATPase [Victivallales bacterium]